MRVIAVPGDVVAAMIAHGRETLPHEACGLLFGREGRVTKIVPVGSASPSPVSYQLDASEQMRAFSEARGEGLALVAIYHSHPSSPAYPSPTDVERAFFPGTRLPNYPGVAYVIVSFMESRASVRAFDIFPDGTDGVEEVGIAEA